MEDANYEDAKTILNTTNDDQEMSRGMTKETLAAFLKDKYAKGELQMVLEKYDKNSDGVLDDQELEKLIDATLTVRQVQTLLKEFDVNGDGVLNPDEAQALADAYEKKRPETAVLERWDTNRDGRLDATELQQLFDDVTTTPPGLRYAAYSFTFKTLLFQSVRYTAYTSDLGESFRPIIPPRLVTASYAASWTYVLGDVGWEAYKAKTHHNKTGSALYGTIAERFLFQSFASMLIPAFLIHSTVKLGKIGFSRYFPRFQRWGPTCLGLCVVPFLPVIVDPPVEHALEFCKHKISSSWRKRGEHKEN